MVTEDEGASLDCETCIAYDTSCVGSRMTCSAGQDTCMVGLSKTSVAGFNIPAAAKSCQSHEVCNFLEPIYMDFGKRNFIRARGVCCLEDACITASPQLPPVNTTTNGNQCPACFSLSSDCYPELLDCTGSENYCFELATQTIKGESMSITLKGCTTESFCAALQSGKVSLADIGISLAKAGCQLAKQAIPSA
ncbi:phospholipase A2 inhibitor gamma subunit B-like [Rhineura floridana]|uniref:phospholipase A2 inhibitor gamma subunit B-like n=1 Tax=Rhineura floridana TaxID=261503 RepID=UPI002AC80A16|nr:phospholipase A2 inhibitor gamma subunit B-like [Rhineura floridana]